MKANNYSDTELVGMIKNGGALREQAFVFLLEKEQKERKIERLLRSRRAKPEEIEEIVDEAMIALNTCILKDNFKKDGSIQAFLVGASKNIWNKMWTRQSRKGTKVAIETLNFPDTEPNAEAITIKKEERLILVSYLDKLSDACKTILKLAYFEERSNEELVKILGYKDKLVVSSKKSKCLRKLVSIINPKTN